MHSYQTLIAEHESLDKLASRLIAMVEQGDEIGAIMNVRAVFTAELDAHLGKEDSFLYEQAIASRGGDFPASVARFNASFADLATDWADYLSVWDTDSVTADWAHFASDTIGLMQRLRERILAENSLIYPLALHQGHIRLRDA